MERDRIDAELYASPMATPNPLARATYLLAAHNHRQLPPDGGFEVAFAGRSNAGKSSALNAICQQNALARVSKTPGRTQQLVFFDVTRPGVDREAQPAEARYLVDLPGYGYAKVPQDLQAHWQHFLDSYFGSREALRGLRRRPASTRRRTPARSPCRRKPPKVPCAPPAPCCPAPHG